MFKLSMIVALVVAGFAAASEPRCLSDFGKTACGFNCVADYNDVRCAQTPEGLCRADFGKVVCWDPPRPSDARGQCRADFGKIACGYTCLAAYGDVQCSQTPLGVCRADYGQVVCWDPPRHVTEKPECRADYGKVACGYHCVAGYGDLQCAQSPEGVCRAEYGKVVCWNPPARRHHGRY